MPDNRLLHDSNYVGRVKNMKAGNNSVTNTKQRKDKNCEGRKKLLQPQALKRGRKRKGSVKKNMKLVHKGQPIFSSCIKVSTKSVLKREIVCFDSFAFHSTVSLLCYFDFVILFVPLYFYFIGWRRKGLFT